MPYLSEHIKKGFEKYKYSCRDTSPVANYIMHPFWNWAVQFLPRWLAPNLMTLIGFLFTVTNFILLAYFDPNYTASSVEIISSPAVPSSIWLLCCILNSLSHHLDGMDGKQARRTGSSSPIGELFDHGCDSWATIFFILSLYSVFGRGQYGASPWLAFSMAWVVMGCFVLSHWEKYITGVLYLPWAYDISQLTMSTAYLVCAVIGSQFFQGYVPKLTISWTELLILSIHVGFWGLTTPATLYNVYRSYKDGTGNMLSFMEALRPLISPGLLLVSSTYWALHSPTNILDSYPRLFMYVVGVVFSNMTCRLIMSQMSTTRADLFNAPGILYTCLAVTIIVWSRSLLEYELLLLQIFTVLVTIYHVGYASIVVNEMLEHFHLRAFVITAKQSD